MTSYRTKRLAFLLLCIIPVVSSCTSVKDATNILPSAIESSDPLNNDLSLSALSSTRVRELIEREALDMTAEEIRSLPYGDKIVAADGTLLRMPEIRGLRRITNLVAPSSSSLYPDLLTKLSNQTDFSSWYTASLEVPEVGVIGTVWFPEKEIRITSTQQEASRVILYEPYTTATRYENQLWLPERAIKLGITTKPPSLYWTVTDDGNRRRVWTFSKNNQNIMYDPYTNAQYVIRDNPGGSLTAQSVSSDIPDGYEYVYKGKKVKLERVK